MRLVIRTGSAGAAPGEIPRAQPFSWQALADDEHDAGSRASGRAALLVPSERPTPRPRFPDCPRRPLVENARQLRLRLRPNHRLGTDIGAHFRTLDDNAPQPSNPDRPSNAKQTQPNLLQQFFLFDPKRTEGGEARCIPARQKQVG